LADEKISIASGRPFTIGRGNAVGSPYFAMLASVLAAFGGLFVDKKKHFAALTLICFVPVLVLDGLAAGCN
jgi:hypothetical protein